MTYAPPDLTRDPDTLPRMPSWITSARPEATEDVAFLSGAALATLHGVVGHQEVPHALWRERLALRAAEACVKFSGRPERAGELRDEVHLLRPGNQPGPAGGVYLTWRGTVERPVSVKTLHLALPARQPEQIAAWLDRRGVGQGGPIARSAAVLETVMAKMPRQEATALILADAALAQALGWNHLVPLLAADLARRSAHLQGSAPKLRAKGAGEAVEMFLTRDAVAPAALISPVYGLAGGPGMSDRAARRLCDRLVALGVVRELTGRDTFRLYGV